MIARSTLPSSPPANDVGPLPASALQQLSGRLGARTLARARLYDAWRAVYDGRVRGAAVKARCEGSQGEAWRVTLRVDGEGCVRARCSCPVGSEGDCKHVGATLLAWRARPQRFARAPSVHDCLDAMDAPALRAMLRELAARSEELESLVESLLPEVPAPPTEGWGERVGEAFRHRGAGPGAGDALADDLDRLLADGAASLGPGNLCGLAALHAEVVRAVLGRARRLGDEAAPLRAVVRRCLDATAEAARGLDEDCERREALWSLVDLVRFDIERGVAAHASAPGRLAVRRAADVGSAEDRAWLADRVRDQLEDSDTWAMRAWSAALAELTEGAMDDGPWLDLCREHQLHALMARRLLALGRGDEALRCAAMVSDAALLELADAFARSHRGDDFAALVATRVGRCSEANRVRLAGWLSARAESLRDDLAAAEVAERVFGARSTRESLAALRESAGRAGTWSAVRARAYALLEASAQPLLVEALMEEGDLGRAVEVATAPRARSPAFRAVRAALVEALAPRDPGAAADVLRAQAVGLIAQRGRASYAEACRCLARAQGMLVGVGAGALAERWIDEVRAQHGNLPALTQLLDLHFGEPARATG